MTTFLREPEMAKQLSVTPRTLRSWRSKRVVPFIKIKKVILFDPHKVVEALGKFERVAIGRTGGAKNLRP
jgi:hypothetical protein